MLSFKRLQAALEGNEMQVFRCATTLAIICMLLGMGAEASAQTPEQFYKGKSIDFVIGYPPGGSNDVWGRLIARYIG
jgi:tripartite-type tricarboxylate transporter receptor subunit TctC